MNTHVRRPNRSTLAGLSDSLIMNWSARDLARGTDGVIGGWRTSCSRRTWPARSRSALRVANSGLSQRAATNHFALPTGALRRRVHGVVIGCPWEVVQSGFVHPAWVMLGARPTRTLCRLHSNVGGGVRVVAVCPASGRSDSRCAAHTDCPTAMPGGVDDEGRSPERIPMVRPGVRRRQAHVRPRRPTA